MAKQVQRWAANDGKDYATEKEALRADKMAEFIRVMTANMGKRPSDELMAFVNGMLDYPHSLRQAADLAAEIQRM